MASNSFVGLTATSNLNGSIIEGIFDNVSVTPVTSSIVQTITFNAIAAQTVGTPLDLVASASSGLAVTFSSLTTGVCTVSGSTATFIAAGTCTIQASQAGVAGSYAAATPVSQSFTVQKAISAISWSNPASIIYGTALGAVQLNATASVPGVFVYSPAAGTVLPPGNSQTLSATFTPANGAAYAPASATVQISVVFTGSAPTSGTTCNGAYNGTFTGNLTVSAGQNCIFVDGRVTGNVLETGGNIGLIQTQVGGNVQVNGSATFTIGPGSNIKGNLQIQNSPNSSAQNQICGSTIQGDLEFQNNRTAVLIGASAPATCAGNTINGNVAIQNNPATVSVVGNTVGNSLTVQNDSAVTIVVGNHVTGNLVGQSNTAPIQVFTNAVGNNLQCQSNTSITGGGNTAKGKQGQCSAF